jgi:leucyl/phenylalanyl-tRNA---protein transferase
MTLDSLPYLETNGAFPSPELALVADSEAPGLLALGGSLEPAMLLKAYSNGIFPWFSAGEPILWWSPDPRMVLRTDNFKLHRSLEKTIRRFCSDPNNEIKVDFAFEAVIQACASNPRRSHTGTWIVPSMVEAYTQLHHASYAHSIETWVDGKLVGGLYCVAIGNAVFGESMFSHATDASKIALTALVAICRTHQVAWIDCQQNTKHLASMGAAEIPRSAFLNHVRKTSQLPGPQWQFSPLYWQHVLPL